MSNRKHLEHLFISKVRIKALRYFFQHPDKPIHLRATVRELSEEINAVRRELSRMEKSGLLIAEKRGNKKFFLLNKDFPFTCELMGIIAKSFGFGNDLIEQKKNLGDIHYAVLTQGYTHRQPLGKHQLDLLVVGENVNLQLLKTMVEQEEKRIGRDIYYAVLSPNDFEMRKKRKDQFVIELCMQDYTVLVGSKEQMWQGLS